MLNYLGPQIGQGPIASQLPPATPGTMPQGVPGIAANPPPIPPGVFHHPSAHGASPAPHHVLAAILKHAASGGGEAPPPLPEYGTETQADGSILLHVKGPNGERGPVVKVIPALKHKGEPSK